MCSNFFLFYLKPYISLVCVLRLFCAHVYMRNFANSIFQLRYPLFRFGCFSINNLINFSQGERFHID